METMKLSRRQGRYVRRQRKRLANKTARALEVGGIEDVFDFEYLYRIGKECCNRVRWKASIQHFEIRLFAEVARIRRQVLDGTWKPGRFNSFLLTERGKTRPIDAPHVRDRVVHKAYTREVLLPLYSPSLINDNGASLKGKGFKYAQEQLKAQMRRFYREHGREGYVILLDFERFFPSASHDAILARHERYIPDGDLRAIGDAITCAKKDGVGVPLGVEVSQIEMVALPSALDNHIRCQLHIRESGHYMDDYHLIVPKGTDADALIDDIVAFAAKSGLTINKSKTRVIPLDKSFKFCKATYRVTDTGAIKVKGSMRSWRVARRKMNMMADRLKAGEITPENVRDSYQSSVAYFKSYNNHYKVVRLRRMHHTLFEQEADNNIGGDIA